jgi:glycosyltransferase involved in cell wall biosynthesis
LAVRLKIARVIARLNVGGPAIQAVSLTRVLADRGHNCALLCGEVPRGETEMSHLLEQLHVTPVRIDSMSRRLSAMGDLRALFRIRSFLKSFQPDVVHTHTAKAGGLGRLAAILARVPVRVHTFHGHVFHGYFSRPVTAIFVAIERMLARFTHAIIAISESQKRELVDIYRIAPECKVHVVPLGFDLDRFTKVQRPASPERLRVLWVGRFAPVKDPFLFVEAVRTVGGEIDPIMVGDGALRAPLERSVGGGISFAGIQTDMAAVYANADMVVLTSKNEGTPVALIEAMASGLPVLSVDVGGVRDLMSGQENRVAAMRVFENGVLVPRSAAALAEAITFLQSDASMRMRMGEAGRNFVRTNFSMQRLANDLEKLYLSLLADDSDASESRTTAGARQGR